MANNNNFIPTKRDEYFKKRTKIKKYATSLRNSKIPRIQNFCKEDCSICPFKARCEFKLFN